MGSPLPCSGVIVCVATVPSSYLAGVIARQESKQATKTGDNGNAMLPKKSSNFKDTRQEISVPLAMSPNVRKKVSNLKKNLEKHHSWVDICLLYTSDAADE